jgi:hypothetical protein
VLLLLRRRRQLSQSDAIRSDTGTALDSVRSFFLLFLFTCPQYEPAHLFFCLLPFHLTFNTLRSVLLRMFDLCPLPGRDWFFSIDVVYMCVICSGSCRFNLWPSSLAVAIGAHFPSRVLSSFLADVCLVGLTRVLAFSKYYFPCIALNHLLKMLLLLALRCLSPRSLYRETLELFLLIVSLDVFCTCATLGWVGFQDLLAGRF